jgi:hypothetical protein
MQAVLQLRLNFAAILVDVDEMRQQQHQDNEQYENSYDGDDDLSHNGSCSRTEWVGRSSLSAMGGIELVAQLRDGAE